MANTTIKIVDGFVWRLLNLEQAKAFFNADIDDLYILHGDDTESAVEGIGELDDYDQRGFQFGIEVGYIDYKEQGDLNTNS